MPKKEHHVIQKVEWILYICMFLFSAWLMFHTFSYISETKTFLMASRVWSDFGAHIPLIRSFSLGSNWPPEYPLFPGEPIRYHFLFYALAGLLERIGFRIDLALNIPSVIGFFFLLFFLYKLGVLVSRQKLVGFLSVLFFLFNGSLSFLQYLKEHPYSPTFFQDLLKINDFATFGPWDGNLVTAFGHLNVYTNQRHLAPSFALSLALLFLFLNIKNVTKKTLLLTILIVTCTLSALLFMNQAALLPTLIICAFLFLAVPHARLPLFFGSIFSLPFLALFSTIAVPTGSPVFEPGYLSVKPFAWQSFIEFWIHNAGLHFLFIPLGMLVMKRPYRWIALPVLIVFIIPNMFRLSTDMINNHKLINFVMLFGSIYSAVVVAHIARLAKRFAAVIIIPVLFLLTCSGILDFLVIKNDYYLYLEDIPKNKDATIFVVKTPPNAVILNSTWFYHPASLAGRSIYNGYAFFTWSAGYETYKREAIVKSIYRSEDMAFICSTLKDEKIDFVELNKQPDEYLKPISTVWKTMSPVLYENKQSGLQLFDVQRICP